MHRGQRWAVQGGGARYELQCLLCRCGTPACLSKLQHRWTLFLRNRKQIIAHKMLSAALVRMVRLFSLEKRAEKQVRDDRGFIDSSNRGLGLVLGWTDQLCR